MKAARARGRLGGRRTVITEHKLRGDREMLDGGRHTMQQIAALEELSQATTAFSIGAARSGVSVGVIGSRVERLQPRSVHA